MHTEDYSKQSTQNHMVRKIDDNIQRIVHTYTKKEVKNVMELYDLNTHKHIVFAGKRQGTPKNLTKPKDQNRNQIRAF